MKRRSFFAAFAIPFVPAKPAALAASAAALATSSAALMDAGAALEKAWQMTCDSTRGHPWIVGERGAELVTMPNTIHLTVNVPRGTP